MTATCCGYADGGSRWRPSDPDDLRCGTMSEDEPLCELHNDGENIFVLIDGVKIAKRGTPDTAQAMTWILLEPGWTVRDIDHGNAIEVRYEGARIH
jgi:hypothetical protein